MSVKFRYVTLYTDKVMSNLIQKLFIESTTVIPGAIIKRWVPAVTEDIYTPFGYYNGTKVYGASLPYDPIAGGFPLGTISATVLEYPDQPQGPTNPVITVLVPYKDVEHTVVTTPGYFSYDTSPDSYNTTYDPNLGWNSGGRSYASALGDVTATFTVPVDVTGVIVGLTNITDAFAGEYRHIRYSLAFTSGVLRVIDNALLIAAGNYTTTDVFSIARSGNDIFYAKNGNVFYKATTPNTAELTLDSILYAGGDSVINATFDETTVIDQRSAALANTASTLTATPKPAAILANTAATLSQNGYWFDGTNFHASGAALVATSTLTVTKEFASASLVATSTLTGTGHHVNEIHGVFGQMTASLTEGYYAYAEVKASLPSMTAQAGADTLAFEFDYIAASFPQMEVTAHSLVGQTNLPSTMYLPSMGALAADHPYAQVTGSFQRFVYVAGVGASYGNYVVTDGPSFALTARGFPEGSNFVDTDLFMFSAASSGGATSANSLFSLALTSTGTMLDTGAAALLPLFTSTLSATGRMEGHGNVDLLPFFESTITSFGGAAAALTAPVFTVDSTGTGIVSGQAASLPFFTLGLAATGTKVITGSANIPFISFGLSYATVNVAGPSFTITASGSTVVNNAVAYVMNVHTQESTKYSNFGFMHIVQIGGKPYGVKADGLYLLEGANDVATAINGTLTTKETDFGDFKAKMVPKVYLNTDSSTNITPYTDGVAGPTYPGSFSGRKTTLGRGLEARYWKFKISNIQQLEGLEFITESKQRRVK